MPSSLQYVTLVPCQWALNRDLRPYTAGEPFHSTQAALNSFQKDYHLSNYDPWPLLQAISVACFRCCLLSFPTHRSYSFSACLINFCWNWTFQVMYFSNSGYWFPLPFSRFVFIVVCLFIYLVTWLEYFSEVYNACRWSFSFAPPKVEPWVRAPSPRDGRCSVKQDSVSSPYLSNEYLLLLVSHPALKTPLIMARWLYCFWQYPQA